MKILLLVLALSLGVISVSAQLSCNAQSIYGLWKVCGWVYSTYDHPPGSINADSLKNAFPSYNNSGYTWKFDPNDTCEWKHPDYSAKAKFRVDEKDCKLWLSSRKRSPMYIMYQDDSCMIVWHNNPKTAYLIVYRR